MHYNSLKEFIKFLEKKKLLVRISQPVSTYLEMTEVEKRFIEKRAQAILFENVHIQHKIDGSLQDYGKSPFPVLVGLFGSVERVALAMGRVPSELKEFGRMLAFLRQPEPPKSIKEAMAMTPLLKKMLSMKPKTSSSKAICQEITLTEGDIDIFKLPIQTCWPGDVSPLITFPLVVTEGPDKKGDKEDSFNLGVYRMQPIAKNKCLMRWLKHRGGAEHYRRWSKSGKPARFPAACVIGADPGVIMAAVTPVPDTLSEYDFAGLLRGRRLELVKCKTIPLKVPATAEIVLEGYVSLEEYADEGPFGDHTGYYNAKEPFPVFEITAITHQKQPIYHSTYTGRPPDEPSILGEALNDVFVPLLQQQFPEIVDFWLPPEGCSYRVACVAIKKAYPGHARRIMMGVWSFLRQFIYTKFIIIVDEDINPRNWEDVIWAISTNMDPVRDVMMVENTPIDYLDFASEKDGLGSKMGLDATTKIPPETEREWGRKIEMSKEVIAKVDKLMKEIL